MRQPRKPNQHEIALMKFLGVSSEELKRHSPTVYEWRGIYFEILTIKQVREGKVPASWYASVGEWRLREMGKQATKVKKILERR